MAFQIRVSSKSSIFSQDTPQRFSVPIKPALDLSREVHWVGIKSICYNPRPHVTSFFPDENDGAFRIEFEHKLVQNLVFKKESDDLTDFLSGFNRHIQRMDLPIQLAFDFMKDESEKDNMYVKVINNSKHFLQLDPALVTCLSLPEQVYGPGTTTVSTIVVESEFSHISMNKDLFLTVFDAMDAISDKFPEPDEFTLDSMITTMNEKLAEHKITMVRNVKELEVVFKNENPNTAKLILPKRLKELFIDRVIVIPANGSETLRHINPQIEPERPSWLILSNLAEETLVDDQFLPILCELTPPERSGQVFLQFRTPQYHDAKQRIFNFVDFEFVTAEFREPDLRNHAVEICLELIPRSYLERQSEAIERRLLCDF